MDNLSISSFIRYSPLFQPPIDGHWSRFKFLALLNKAAVNPYPL